MAAPPPPPAAPPRVTIPELVARVLAFMDRPWKAVVVIVLIILGGLGFGVWQERAAILAAFKAPRPLVLVSDPTIALDGLLNTTGIDWTSLWAVDFAGNAQTFVIARRRGGGLWEFRPARLPLIRATTDPTAIVKALAGNPLCGLPMPDEGSLLLRRLARDGMTWFCLAPVPPIAGPLAIGALYIAWRDKPDPDLEAAALGAAIEAARRLVTR